MNGANFSPSPIYEYMVYRVYRMRDSGKCFCRVFNVWHTGFLYAKLEADKHERQKEIEHLFSSNLVSSWFYCSKRIGEMKSDKHEKGYCEYVGEYELNEKQIKYFSQNRMTY